MSTADFSRVFPADGEISETRVLPIIEETLEIERRQIHTGGVLLKKIVSTHEETINLALNKSEVIVERREIGTIVPDNIAPAVRSEGGTTIYPIVKEILVTEKRLLLVAELHVRRIDVTYHEPQTVSLRNEDIVIERLDGAAIPPSKI